MPFFYKNHTPKEAHSYSLLEVLGKYSCLIALLAPFALWQSCSNDEPVEIPTIHFENSNLEVKVRAETDTGAVLLPGATVSLYGNLADRAEAYKLIHSDTTDGTGIARFTALAKPEYWIMVKSPIDGQVMLFLENSPYPTPGPPVVLNRLDVLFRK